MRMRKELLIALLSTMLYFMAVQLIAAVIARYCRDLGIDIATTGTLWSLVPLVSLILRPLGGYIADKLSSFFAMMLGGLFTILSAVAYLRARSIDVLVYARVLQGVGGAFFISPSIAAVATVAGPRMGEALGLRAVLLSLAGLVAPVVSGFLVDEYGYHLVFILGLLLALMVTLLNVPVLIVDKRPTDGDSGSWRDAINKFVLLMMLVAVCGGSIFMTVTGLLQAHYRDLGYEAKQFGYFMMLFGVSGMVSRYVAGKLCSYREPSKIALVGYLMASASMLILGRMYEVPSSYIVAVLYGIGIGLTVPSMQLMVVRAAPPHSRNRAVSVYAMGFDLGGFLAPNIFGYVALVYGYEFSYMWMALPPLVASLILSLVALGKVKRPTFA